MNERIKELIAELMNPNNPKNEREPAAVLEIERLREDEQGVDAVDTLTELQSAWLLESTQTLAKTLARKFYPEVTQWECLNDLAGVISQIDNMTTGLMRKPEQEPVYQYQLASGLWIDQAKERYDYNVKLGQDVVRVVYTTPPQRPPLTTEQLPPIPSAYLDGVYLGYCKSDFTAYARAIEAAHGIGDKT